MLLVLGGLASARSTISPMSFYATASVDGAGAVSMLLAGLSALRGGTIRLWADRLAYHSMFGEVTFAKRDIVSVGEGVMPSPATPLGVFLRALVPWRPGGKPGWRRLCLTLSDQRVVWIKEFSAPYATGFTTSGSGARNYAELRLAVSELEDWLMGRPRSPVRPIGWR
jgi:hypothetical protein